MCSSRYRHQDRETYHASAYRNLNGCLFQLELNLRLPRSCQRSGTQVFTSLSQFNQPHIHEIVVPLEQIYSFLKPNPHLPTSPAKLTVALHPRYGTAYRITYEKSRCQLPRHLPNTSNDISSLIPSLSDHKTLPRMQFDSKSFDIWYIINLCTTYIHIKQLKMSHVSTHLTTSHKHNIKLGVNAKEVVEKLCNHSQHLLMVDY